MEKNDYVNLSYKQQADGINKQEMSINTLDELETTLKKGSVDEWRHVRMYQALDPILEIDTKAKWLTVGDGRFGKDSKYIKEKGCSVLASDLSQNFLEIAKKVGYIDDYKIENAEKLSFEDNEFDYVFCKEAYHHFPRPMIALYEMLRVANKGIVLIEPNDAFTGSNFIRIILRTLKSLVGKKVTKHNYETVGNYVFTISRREIEKVALGLNYKTIAFKGVNDTYIVEAGDEKFSDNGPIQKKIRKKINLANILCKLNFTDYALLSTIIFKEKPSNELLNNLIKFDYTVIHLPNNPYA